MGVLGNNRIREQLLMKWLILQLFKIPLKSSFERKQTQMQKVLVVIWFRTVVFLPFHSLITDELKRLASLCPNLSMTNKLPLELHR